MNIQRIGILCRQDMRPTRCLTILAIGKSLRPGGNCGFTLPRHPKYVSFQFLARIHSNAVSCLGARS